MIMIPIIDREPRQVAFLQSIGNIVTMAINAMMIGIQTKDSVLHEV